MSLATEFVGTPSENSENITAFNHRIDLYESKEPRSAGFILAPAKPGWLGLVDAVLKRVFDIGISLALLILLSPVFLVLAVLVRIDGGPAFYSHTRVGKGLRNFNCLKFRSMMPGAQDILEEYFFYNPAESQYWKKDRKLRFDPRITPIGKFLRVLSLDELPQLFNILQGEMSLVGPRPITRDEVANYGALIGFYASVKPGLTGLWQVSGRNDVEYEARVALDRCYASFHNVVLDAAILLGTPRAVLCRRGAR